MARASAAGAPLGSGVHQAFNSINTQVSIGNSLPSAIGPPAIGQIGNGLSHPGCFPVPCAIAPVVRPACCRTLRRPNFCTSCSHPARANAIGLARASGSITSIGIAQSLSKCQPLSPPPNIPAGNYKSPLPRLGIRKFPRSRLHRRRQTSQAILNSARPRRRFRIGKSVSGQKG